MLTISQASRLTALLVIAVAVAIPQASFADRINDYIEYRDKGDWKSAPHHL